MSRSKKKSVLVLGYSGYADPFRILFPKVIGTSLRLPPEGIKNVPSLLLFTGGEDISPALYGEESHYSGNYISLRCQWEMVWYDWALKNNIPMFGTCRGMQFFTAMNGGKLLQHVDNHLGGHSVTITYPQTETLRVNSIHHQMCLPNDDALLLAYAQGVINPKYIPSSIPPHLVRDNSFAEPEALLFPKVRALGVQWHPEGMFYGGPANKWVLDRIEEYLL